MKKYITKELMQPLKVIVLGLALGVGLNVAFAGVWTAPTATPPGNNTPPPCVGSGTENCINTSVTAQFKDWTGTQAGTLSVGRAGSGKGVGLESYGSLNYERAATFGGLDVGSNSAITVGAQTFGGSVISNFFGDINLNKGLLTIDKHTGAVGSAGRDMYNFIARDGSLDTNRVSGTQNKPFFQIWDTKNNKEGIFQGRSIKITEGTPSAGKVLGSPDGSGIGTWSTFYPGNIDIVYVATKDNDTGDPRYNKAYCPASYKAIGGGGDCESGAISVSRPILGTPKYNGGDYTWQTNPEALTDTGSGAVTNSARDGWLIGCNGGDGDIHVDVICMKVNSPSISVPAAPQFNGDGLETAPVQVPGPWQLAQNECTIQTAGDPNTRVAQGATYGSYTSFQTGKCLYSGTVASGQHTPVCFVLGSGDDLPVTGYIPGSIQPTIECTDQSGTSPRYYQLQTR